MSFYFFISLNSLKTLDCSIKVGDSLNRKYLQNILPKLNYRVENSREKCLRQ